MSSPLPRNASNSNDPYAGNILVQGLGPILDRSESAKRLMYLPPPAPDAIATIPYHIRLHMLASLLDLHIPGLSGSQIYESIDLLIRQSYRHRDPRKAATWALLNGHRPPPAPAMATVAVGHSGTGKTRSVQRALQCYPQQIIVHDHFPNLNGPHAQMVWLSVDIPPSGRREDLAANLMIAWDNAMATIAPNGIRRFEDVLSKTHRKGQQMLDEWLQVAISHFLGGLHLDEVQNLFKLATLKQRRRTGKHHTGPELAIAEDECLRWILSLLNRWNIPVIFSGTPDGVGALTKRMSTAERISVGGYHKLAPFSDPDSKTFGTFFVELLRHQYVKTPLSDSDEFRCLVLDLTAGVPRIIIALWIAAHRVAFEKMDDTLEFADFQKAASTLLAPLAPAVAALRSGDPELMRRYEDLIPRDDAVWASFWNAT